MVMSRCYKHHNVDFYGNFVTVDVLLNSFSKNSVLRTLCCFFSSQVSRAIVIWIFLFSLSMLFFRYLSFNRLEYLPAGVINSLTNLEIL